MMSDLVRESRTPVMTFRRAAVSDCRPGGRDPRGAKGDRVVRAARAGVAEHECRAVGRTPHVSKHQDAAQLRASGHGR